MPYYQKRGNVRRPTNARPNTKKTRGEYINPSRFIQAAKPVEQAAYQPQHAFSDFALHPLLLQNLTAHGLTTPTPIQDQSIPHGLAGKDVVGLANTGTGKTIAFALPMLHRLMSDPNARALIKAPTRELAQQIQDECKMLARGSGLFGALLIGGAPMNPQLRDLSVKPTIVIGTPGRIKDHLERGTLDLRNFNTVVLDEVDRMLDMGFVADMRRILSQVNPEHQSFFYSATMDQRVRELIGNFSNDPITVSVTSGHTSDSVEQNIVRFSDRSDKMEKLHDLLIDEGIDKVLVFDETQRSVERLSHDLNTRGFTTDAIHGGKSQAQRQRALKRFKNNEVKILVATDVAARGIDIADITHVINYSTPQSYSDYVHRVGRAGRAGRQGHALTFVAH